MSNTLTEFYKEQYSGFSNVLISDWGISASQLNTVSAKSKALHKKYLALACAFSIVGYRKPRNEYASSVVDVSQLAIILAHKGAENSANVLLRQSMELALKHIYFQTHPTEYGWTQTRDDYRDLGFQKLLEYIQMTDEFKDVNNNKLLLDQFNHHYAVLSRYVHAHSGKFQNFSSLHPSKAAQLLDKLMNVATTLWPAVICLIIIFSAPQYNRASALEKRLIRSGLTPKFRTFLSAYLRNME